MRMRVSAESAVLYDGVCRACDYARALFIRAGFILYILYRSVYVPHTLPPSVGCDVTYACVCERALRNLCTSLCVLCRTVLIMYVYVARFARSPLFRFTLLLIRICRMAFDLFL